MKITMFLLLLLGLTMGVRAEKQITISGFQNENIKGIKASGAFQIKMQKSENTGARLEIPERFKDQLIFILKDNGVLEIGFKGNIKAKNNDHFIAEIGCSDLERIDLSGACRLVGQGDFTASNLSVDLSGATNVVIEGNFWVNGNVKLDFSGASKFNSGVKAVNLDIDLSGASNLVLRGNAAHADIDLSGASKIAMVECVVDNMSLSTSGASHATVNAKERLDISSSGASKISYCGSPKMGIHTSGAASISQI